jgi:hypothetical protein
MPPWERALKLCAPDPLGALPIRTALLKGECGMRKIAAEIGVGVGTV